MTNRFRKYQLRETSDKLPETTYDSADVVMHKHSIEPIADIYNDFESKFGIPRQSGLVDEVISTIIFRDGYRNPDSLRGIEGFSHLWLIWQFSKAEQKGFSPTVRPPRLGGNMRMGVFATRSPFRPNRLGLSSVRLISANDIPRYGTVLYVGGADILSGTPIFDIKPYLANTDCHPDASGGFAKEAAGYMLKTECPPELLTRFPDSKAAALMSILAQDPRPSYQHDPDREYGMSYAGYDIKFHVDGTVLTVTDISSRH